MNAERRVELSVLATLLEELPGGLSEDEVVEILSQAGRTPERDTEVRHAVQGLIEAGLAEKVGSQLSPTAATARLAEMEVEL